MTSQDISQPVTSRGRCVTIIRAAAAQVAN